MSDKEIEFIGNVGVNVFRCEMCSNISKFKYLKRPNEAVAALLTDRKFMDICRKCAKRENGSKNKRGWERIHEKEAN